MDMDDSFE